MPRSTTIGELLERYEGVLLDAYGVLVDERGALPGAARLLEALRGRPHAVVTNDASRTPATSARRFASLGLAIPEERVITSGTLVEAYIRDRGLAGARICVLGTDDSRAHVRAGGGVPVALAPGIEVDAVAICDDAGAPLLDATGIALSAIVRAVEAGRRPALVLANPDLVFPRGGGELGVTAGGIALVIEAVLERRFRGAGLVFDRLGKPAPGLFEAAAARLGVRKDRLIMIGDQLETDIAGAAAAGIDSALVEGVSRWDGGPVAPTWLLGTIEP